MSSNVELRMDGRVQALIDESTVRELEHVLQTARQRLDMDLAWVSATRGDRQFIDATDGDARTFGLQVGSSAPLEGSYTALVLAAGLACVIADTAADPDTANLPITHQLGIGAYVGVPIQLADGRIFGTLCCLSHKADPRLSPRDGWSLAPVAQIVSELVQRAEAELVRRQRQEARIVAAVAGEGRATVFQPIVNLKTFEVMGAEALTRFGDEHGAPADWFSAAGHVGLAVALELAAISDAVDLLDEFPADTYMSVNASPVTASSPLLEERLASCDGERVVVEITQDVPGQDYATLNVALARLRRLGIRVAVDDAGNDFAGLSRLLEAPPDFIKLDMATVRGIDSSSVQVTLASSLMKFVEQLDSTVVAVGIETESELETLLGLGVQVGQGYLFARPAPLPLPNLRRAAVGS